MILSARNLLAEMEKYKKIVNPFGAVCQCRHETAYQGKPWNSELCKQANNLAGLKRGSGWTGQVYAKKSWEQKPTGEKYEQVSEFRKYLMWEDFVADYAKKIERDYPACAASADNFFGYFSGLFRGRFGAWATDLAYLDRLLDQVLILAPEIFGSGWQDKVWAAFLYAVDNKRLTPEHETIIHKRLNAAIPQGGSLFDDEPSAAAPSKRLICIDPGHGGPDPGAIGQRGTKEAEINLAFAQALAKELQALGLDVVMTRDGPSRLKADYKQDLAARPEVANAAKADIFVSIHCNSATTASAAGFEIYTTPGQNNSDKLATAIFDAWKSMVSSLVRPDYSDGDPDKEANFAVIRGTKCPSCLVELAFISNPGEEANLNDAVWRQRGAQAIAEGVKAYFEA